MVRWTFTFAGLFATFSVSSVSMSQNASGQEFKILAWNVESNRPNQAPVSDANVLAMELETMLRSDATRSQIVSLSEVEPKTFSIYVQAVAKGMQSEVDYVTTASGGYHDSDSVMLIVDKKRFEIVDTLELHRFGGMKGNFNVETTNGDDLGELRARSPLAARVRDLQSKKTFWVVANHLARGEADLRTSQAKMLGLWAQSQPDPVIAVGDFNFDYDFATQKGNEGFKAMLESGVWQWLKPDPLIDSNWSDDRRVTDRRVDRYPDSLLDFVFVANGAKSWKGEADVVVRPNDFPDSDKTSDHRPMISRFTP